MTRLRLAKINELQFLTCLKYSIWGSQSARFKDWLQGDYLAFIVDKELAGLAEVSGKPFHSVEKIWDKGVYPHRIPIKSIHILAKEQRIPIFREIKTVLISAFGPKYGWGILFQCVLTGANANIIVNAIRSRPNRLSAIDIEQLLVGARKQEKIS